MLHAIVPPVVTPEQIKQLRQELRCTARELASTLDLPLAEVQAWELGREFPTKRLVTQLGSLRTIGPSAIVRKGKAGSASVMEQLDNPDLWQLVRKLLAHPELLRQALELATPYDDPAKVAGK